MDQELYSKLMDYALRLLGRRAYTVHEMTQKLEARTQKLKADETVLSPTIQTVLNRLTELHYLDDADFCRRWVEERSRLRPRGEYRLTQELRKKGIPKEILDTFWSGEEGQQFDEIPLALQLIEQKRRRIHGGNEWEIRQKLYRFLASRGFSVSTIREALDKAENQ